MLWNWPVDLCMVQRIYNVVLVCNSLFVLIKFYTYLIPLEESTIAKPIKLSTVQNIRSIYVSAALPIPGVKAYIWVGMTGNWDTLNSAMSIDKMARSGGLISGHTCCSQQLYTTLLIKESHFYIFILSNSTPQIWTFQNAHAAMSAFPMPAPISRSTNSLLTSRNWGNVSFN